MLAIPIFRARVAPVLDWCQKIVLVAEDGADAASGREIDLTEIDSFTLLRILREEGIKTLICGVLSPEVLRYGESLGLRILSGVAGEIDEVLRAYRERKLDQPQYRLPGCRGPRRCRGGAGCVGRARGGGKGQGGRTGGGPAGKRAVPSWRMEAGRFFLCPHCGVKVRRDGQAAYGQIRCPACNGLIFEN